MKWVSLITAFIFLSAKSYPKLAHNIVCIVRYMENDKKILFLSDTINYSNDSESFEIKLWDLESGNIVWENAFDLQMPTNLKKFYRYAPLDMIIMNDNKTVCAVIGGYGFVFFNYFTGKLINQKFIDFRATYGDTKELLGAVAFSEDKRYVAIAGQFSAFVTVLQIEEVRADTSLVLDLDFIFNKKMWKTGFGLSADATFTYMKFSKDGKLIFVSDNHGYLFGWSLTDTSFLPDPILVRKIATTKQKFNRMWAIDLTDSIIITTSDLLPKFGVLQLWNLKEVSLTYSDPDIVLTTAKRVVVNQEVGYGVITSDVCYAIIRIDSNKVTPVFNIFFLHNIAGWFDNLSSVAFSKQDGVVALGIDDNVYLFNYYEGKIIKSVYPTTNLPPVFKK